MLRHRRHVLATAFLSLVAIVLPPGVAGAAPPPTSNAPGASVDNIAHRGASAYAPENTLAAVRLGVEQRGDLVEIDVQRSADGALVVMHDTTLARTTDVEEIFPDRAPWNVGDFTLAELEILDAGSWFGEDFAGEPIPTLAQVLDELGGRAGLLLEVKSPALYPGIGQDILDELESYPSFRNAAPRADRLVVQSFDYGFMEAFNELAPEIPVGLLDGPPSDEVLVEASAWADQINLSFRRVDQAFVERVHELGMTTSVYTVNQEADMRALIDLGVDGIITNHPDVPRRTARAASPREPTRPATSRSANPAEGIALATGCRPAQVAEVGGRCSPGLAKRSMPASRPGPPHRRPRGAWPSESVNTNVAALSRRAAKVPPEGAGDP